MWLALLPKWSHTSVVAVFLMCWCRCSLWCMILLHERLPFQNIPLKIPGCPSHNSSITTCEIQPTFTVWSIAFISCLQCYAEQFFITFSVFPPPFSQPNLHPGCSQEPNHLLAAITPSLYQVNQQKFKTTNIIHTSLLQTIPEASFLTWTAWTLLIDTCFLNLLIRQFLHQYFACMKNCAFYRPPAETGIRQHKETPKSSGSHYFIDWIYPSI